MRMGRTSRPLQDPLRNLLLPTGWLWILACVSQYCHISIVTLTEMLGYRRETNEFNLGRYEMLFLLGAYPRSTGSDRIPKRANCGRRPLPSGPTAPATACADLLKPAASIRQRSGGSSRSTLRPFRRYLMVATAAGAPCLSRQSGRAMARSALAPWARFGDLPHSAWARVRLRGLLERLRRAPS